MNESEKIILEFYSAFQKKDWKGMQACYHPDITFSDPVFTHLKGGEARAMWHMLTGTAKDLSISFKNISSDGRTGSCDWDARYPFSRTGRQVHNVIHADFEFNDGRIIKHKDSFDLWKWSGMALGLSGTLLGWTHMIKSKIRGTAQNNLTKFIEAHPEYKN